MRTNYWLLFEHIEGMKGFFKSTVDVFKQSFHITHQGVFTLKVHTKTELLIHAPCRVLNNAFLLQAYQ